MKFVPDFLKRKSKPETATPEDKTGFLETLKSKFRRNKPETPAPESEKKDESLFDLQEIKQKLTDALDSDKRSRTMNTVLVITGAGLVIGGIAADVTFMGGVGTVTVLSCLYSDFRNAQHIDKVSRELSDIETKIDAMKASQQPAPDYTPALSAVKSSIEDFQARACHVRPDVVEGLAKLKTQVEALEEKIDPANDDKAPKKPASDLKL